MNKKNYMKPSTIEVKVEACQLLNVSVYNEESTNASYGREDDADWDE